MFYIQQHLAAYPRDSFAFSFLIYTTTEKIGQSELLYPFQGRKEKHTLTHSATNNICKKVYFSNKFIFRCAIKPARSFFHAAWTNVRFNELLIVQ